MALIRNIFITLESWLERLSSLVLWGAVAIWYGCIFYLSHIPTSTSASTKTMVGGDDALNAAFRFCAHLGVFGVLGVLAYAARVRSFVFVRRSYIEMLCLVFVLGIFDELHQSFVPGRYARVQDVLTDTSGAAMAVSLIVLVRRKYLASAATKNA